MESVSIMLVLVVFACVMERSTGGLIAEPVSDPEQPLRPGDSSSNTVPAFPVQTSRSEFCHLDLSKELFGGVNDACGHNLDRSRCCPVLAAWLFAAYARSALSISISPAPSPSSGISSPADVSALPMMPDDSQRCVDSLQTSLLNRSIKIPQPNASCDAVLCFCGIRLHQLTSLSCPAAFNLTPPHHNATPMASVRNLEKSCRNSSYSGCTNCLGALQKLKVEEKKGTSRATKMFNRDCKLMGLTWLLARNKTAYIPTVSAVLRAMLYSPHPHENRCSPDQENMPLAVDSLQFYNSASFSPSPSTVSFTLLTLVVALYYSLFSILSL